MDLGIVPTDVLVRELVGRSDLIRQDGLMDPDKWALRPAIGPVACVDAVAIRIERADDFGWRVVGGVIRRNTGRYAGKLALIGGVVARYESIGDALTRHWHADLGLDIELPLGWDHPVCMRQYAPQLDGRNRPDFCHDPGKHSYASTHIVTLSEDQVVDFRSKIGGQEAIGFEWYDAITCPPESEWGYDMRQTFLHVLERAQQARFAIQRYLAIH
ncbi:MAG: hypothetical protein UZ21_OP11001000322 [Microgenomates bacterium OLB22]|nr:MAG: hypothetical protein UZ21_OP11001000322 [Microgenomates bacterium OLB22]